MINVVSGANALKGTTVIVTNKNTIILTAVAPEFGIVHDCTVLYENARTNILFL